MKRLAVIAAASVAAVVTTFAVRVAFAAGYLTGLTDMGSVLTRKDPYD